MLGNTGNAGLGIAVHSAWHVCDDIQAGRLRVVLPDYRLPESSIYALMPERRTILPRVRAFVNLLIGAFGSDPPWEKHLRAPAPCKRG